MSESSVAIGVAQAVLRAAESLGADGDVLRQAAGIDRHTLEDPDAFVTASQEAALWREAYARTGDASLGLRAAQARPRGSWRAIEYAMRSAPTLADALRTLERFARLLHGDRLHHFTLDPEFVARLSVDCPDDGIVSALACDFAMASAMLLSREVTGLSIRPLRVGFRHPAPPAPRAYKEIFDVAVELGASENVIELDASVTAMPTTGADPVLRAVLERYLGADLDRLDPLRAFADRARLAIVRGLGEGDADLSHVARALDLSPRVLQKRLHEAGTSFQDLLDRVREEAARRYLVRADVSVAGTALLLGYSDVTAFHRAFKRWTGLTPGGFRRRARSSVPAASR